MSYNAVWLYSYLKTWSHVTCRLFRFEVFNFRNHSRVSTYFISYMYILHKRNTHFNLNWIWKESCLESEQCTCLDDYKECVLCRNVFVQVSGTVIGNNICSRMIYCFSNVTVFIDNGGILFCGKKCKWLVTQSFPYNSGLISINSAI